MKREIVFNVVVISDQLVEVTAQKRDYLITYMTEHPIFNNGPVSQIVSNYIEKMDPIQLHRMNLVWRGNGGASEWYNGDQPVSGIVRVISEFSRTAILVIPTREQIEMFQIKNEKLQAQQEKEAILSVA